MKTKVPVDLENFETSSATNIVPAIEKTISILNLLEAHENGLTLSEISRNLKLPKTSAFRILFTLKHYGFVEQQNERNCYSLGPRILSLANSVRQKMDISRIALPFMEQLTRETGETSKLAVLRNDEALVIARVKSTREMSITTEVGKRFPLHAGGASKVLLAHLPETEIERIIAKGLKKFTENTITDPNKLKENLDQVIRQGFAEDNEECIEGIKSLACPVFNSEGKMVAAISIPYLATRSNLEKRKSLLVHLFATAREISEALGHGGK